jgi:hypothetical protein
MTLQNHTGAPHSLYVYQSTPSHTQPLHIPTLQHQRSPNRPHIPHCNNPPHTTQAQSPDGEPDYTQHANRYTHHLPTRPSTPRRHSPGHNTFLNFDIHSPLPSIPHSTPLPAKHSPSPTRFSGHSPPQPPLSPPDRAFLHHPPHQTPDLAQTSHIQIT